MGAENEVSNKRVVEVPLRSTYIGNTKVSDYPVNAPIRPVDSDSSENGTTASMTLAEAREVYAARGSILETERK